jgi:iron compound ABC transporter, permease protein
VADSFKGSGALTIADSHGEAQADDKSRLSRRRRIENRGALMRLLLVALLLVLACAVFMVIGARHPIRVLPFRLPKLGALLCVGWASGVSTVMFQTIAGNRILTPSVLGLDSLYSLIQAVLLILFRASGMVALSDLTVFGLTMAVMIGVALALMGLVLRGRRSVTTLVLLGIVLGTFLRSGTTFIQRLLDPNSYLVLQDRLFASFNTVNPRLLVISLVVTAIISLLAIRELRVLDVVSLGPDVATALGVDHRRLSRRVVAMVAVLVSVSTALVGPIMFLGLLVAHLAYWISGTNRHVVTVPMAALVAMFVLVAGQTILTQLLGNNAVLSVVVEFLGGLTLIVLLISSGRRS